MAVNYAVWQFTIHSWLQSGRPRPRQKELRAQGRPETHQAGLPELPQASDTYMSKHQAEESPQARVGPDPGEGTDHVQTQPGQDQGAASEPPPDSCPSPHVWLLDTTLHGSPPWALAPSSTLSWLLLTDGGPGEPVSETGSRCHPDEETKCPPPCGSTRLALDILLLTWVTHPENALHLRITRRVGLGVGGQ